MVKCSCVYSLIFIIPTLSLYPRPLSDLPWVDFPCITSAFAYLSVLVLFFLCLDIWPYILVPVWHWMMGCYFYTYQMKYCVTVLVWKFCNDFGNTNSNVFTREEKMLTDNFVSLHSASKVKAEPSSSSSSECEGSGPVGAEDTSRKSLCRGRRHRRSHSPDRQGDSVVKRVKRSHSRGKRRKSRSRSRDKARETRSRSRNYEKNRDWRSRSRERNRDRNRRNKSKSRDRNKSQERRERRNRSNIRERRGRPKDQSASPSDDRRQCRSRSRDRDKKVSEGAAEQSVATEPEIGKVSDTQ